MYRCPYYRLLLLGNLEYSQRLHVRSLFQYYEQCSIFKFIIQISFLKICVEKIQIIIEN